MADPFFPIANIFLRITERSGGVKKPLRHLIEAADGMTKRSSDTTESIQHMKDRFLHIAGAFSHVQDRFIHMTKSLFHMGKSICHMKKTPGTFRKAPLSASQVPPPDSDELSSTM